jgi:radical SAM superfamily enzyme YgiQ (UPF0313 family)
MGGFGMVVGEGLCYPPLDLLYVASIVGKQGHEVVVIDAEAELTEVERVLEQVVVESPDMVGLATSSATLKLDLALVDSIKQLLPEVVVFVTGSQGSKIPDMAMSTSRVDAVVRGEPELTVSEMVDELVAGRDPLSVDGLSVRRGEEITHNANRPLLKGDALAALPTPARGLLPLSLYRIPTMDGPIQTVQSSRGCPINCTYCGYVVAQGIPWRGRTAVDVFEELREIVEVYGVTNVVFRDPLFAYDRDRVIELCALLTESGLGLKWQCETAIKTLDDELLSLMGPAGCDSVSFGIEAGNEGLQKKYSRGKIKSHDHAKVVVDACRRYGIGTRGFFMIGFPEETLAMAKETMDLAVFLDPDTVQFTAVTPYPDTKLYKESRGEEEFDFTKFTGTTPVGVAKVMSNDQVAAMIRKAYRRFYLRPSRVLNELRRPQLLLQRLRRYIGLVQSASDVS